MVAPGLLSWIPLLDSTHCKTPARILKDIDILLAYLAAPTLSRHEQAEQASKWTNRDSKYSKMKSWPKSAILDGSQEPGMVAHIMDYEGIMEYL